LRSRCVMLPLSPVPRADIEAVLLARRMTKSEATTRAIAARGRPGLALEPEEGDTLGKGFAAGMLTANVGLRLQHVETLAKACEAEDAPTEAWRNALQTAMAECGAVLREKPTANVLGAGLVAAMRAVGSSVSPRIVLEALALRMDGDAAATTTQLLPKHISHGLPELFL
jgi:hypothetical protein